MTSNLSPALGGAARAADAAAVAALVDRYLVTLDDEGELDDAWAGSLFTGDAQVAFPMSAHRGRVGLAAWHRASLAAFAHTQHLGAPAVVEVSGDRAVLRVNVLTTHVHRDAAGRPPLFRAGTLARGEAVRTARGWRLERLSFQVLFTEGEPPARD
ncbi:nuclear transport factor 2 family protein [Streptomyces parvulus]|uniref:nuclear transport factor 2 family protein n=1 Tax=Streptomyces parvulus TaxID=146923 RepID=UPI0033FEA2CD